MQSKTPGIVLLALCGWGTVQAQVPQNGLDVQHYRFAVQIGDSNNIIRGNATVNIKFIKDVKEVVLDLVKKNDAGKGMRVSSVLKNNNVVSFEQDAQHLIIADAATRGNEAAYEIKYEGEPADGLIISKNKYGNRTFFSDHWPNRAHNWLPCNDHLSDKATVEFIVTAPEQYQVISNGLQVEETNLPGHMKLTRWKEDVPLPTKVMSMGAAGLAVQVSGYADCIPVSSWVYPEDKDAGFKGYAMAAEILPFFRENVGPYAYSKLANVQSKTIFGGMENANAIFYSEKSVQDPALEELITHEIAHQWFGNTATETDWPHLWLSEGFATYMAHLYHEKKYGADSLQKRMNKDRNEIIAFSRKRHLPVVDTVSGIAPFELLNENSYQKGGWVLHMLRRKVGDSAFWQGIRAYYAEFAGRNASTDSLRVIFERISRQDLGVFFKQWLYTAGQPKLSIEWQYNAKSKTVRLRITQIQDDLFEFPLEIAFRSGNGLENTSFAINQRITEKEIITTSVPDLIIPDPDSSLLYEANVKRLK